MVIMPVNAISTPPPARPIIKLISIRSGLKTVADTILGRMRKLAEFTPIISIASICSVILMLPISEAMLLPILPARMRAIIVEQNSSTRLSLAITPT